VYCIILFLFSFVFCGLNTLFKIPVICKYEGNSISKLQIEVANYVFELSVETVTTR
jgi:hypothetical protein